MPPSKDLMSYLGQERVMSDFWSWPDFRVFMDRTFRLAPGGAEWMYGTLPEMVSRVLDADKGHYLELDCSKNKFSALGCLQDFVDSQTRIVADRDGAQYVRLANDNQFLCILYRPPHLVILVFSEHERIPHEKEPLRSSRDALLAGDNLNVLHSICDSSRVRRHPHLR